MYYKIEVARLKYPFTEDKRISFIVEYNHKKGLEVEQATDSQDYIALDYSEEDKKAMQDENRLNQIKMLNMTRLDFINCLEELGLTWTNMKAIMAQYPEVEKELTMCSNVYRGNPLIDNMIPMVNKAFGLNITTVDLDNAFKNKAGQICLQ